MYVTIFTIEVDRYTEDRPIGEISNQEFISLSEQIGENMIVEEFEVRFNNDTINTDNTYIRAIYISEE